ncbi:HoxN/HupN/NixA family nickel/cobalt transporter [Leeia speluncae]|nr:sulfite exporter TauE/SafE family protein [Leeia speluncae]
MPPIAELIQQGSTNLWLFIPTAILLGALHGLEPGHSKTMMASFIVAVKGTILQAVLLGLCAALSHSFIVWVLAFAALKLGNSMIAEQAEPYLMLLSGVIVAIVGVWMFWRTRKDNLMAKAFGKAGPNGGVIIGTGHDLFELCVQPSGAQTKLILKKLTASLKPANISKDETAEMSLLFINSAQSPITFQPANNELIGLVDVVLPIAFRGRLKIGHQGHAHEYPFLMGKVADLPTEKPAKQYRMGAVTAKAGMRPSTNKPNLATGSKDELPAVDGYQDAHERAHAEEIHQRFHGKDVTTAQIAMFGLTGGLIPCPASVTVLMVCLHLKQFTLGTIMVASFSLGLAIAMISVGVIAAWGANRITKRYGNLGDIARKMPYFSSLLMLVLALVMAVQGAMAI